MTVIRVIPGMAVRSPDYTVKSGLDHSVSPGACAVQVPCGVVRSTPASTPTPPGVWAVRYPL